MRAERLQPFSASLFFCGPSVSFAVQDISERQLKRRMDVWQPIMPLLRYDEQRISALRKQMSPSHKLLCFIMC